MPSHLHPHWHGAHHKLSVHAHELRKRATAHRAELARVAGEVARAEDEHQVAADVAAATGAILRPPAPLDGA